MTSGQKYDKYKLNSNAQIVCLFAISNITSFVKISYVLNISYVAIFNLEKYPIANGHSSGLQFLLLQLQIYMQKLQIVAKYHAYHLVLS